MPRLNVNVLVASRQEYIKYLKMYLSPVIIKGFETIWDTAKKAEDYKYVKQFQEYLRAIPKWNQTILEAETNRIIKEIPFLMKLITQIFVSNIQILSAVRVSSSNETLTFELPSSQIIVHAIYNKSASNIFNTEHVLTAFSNIHIKQNYETIRESIEQSVDDVIYKMTPIKEILEEYLKNMFNNENSGNVPLDYSYKETQMLNPYLNSFSQIGDNHYPLNAKLQNQQALLQSPPVSPSNFGKNLHLKANIDMENMKLEENLIGTQNILDEIPMESSDIHTNDIMEIATGEDAIVNTESSNLGENVGDIFSKDPFGMADSSDSGGSTEMFFGDSGDSNQSSDSSNIDIPFTESENSNKNTNENTEETNIFDTGNTNSSESDSDVAIFSEAPVADSTEGDTGASFFGNAVESVAETSTEAIVQNNSPEPDVVVENKVEDANNDNFANLFGSSETVDPVAESSGGDEPSFF